MIKELLEQRKVFLLDGAQGTELQKGKTTEEVYRSYLEAGSDVITLNTFDLNTAKLDEALHLIDTEVGVFRAIHSPKLAVGSLGPTELVLSLNKSVSEFNNISAFYHKCIYRFYYHNVYDFIIETATDSLNVKAALHALCNVWKETGVKPNVIVSCSPDRNGYLLDGYHMRSLHDMLISYREIVAAFGINCSFGPKETVGFVHELGTYSQFPIVYYPNNGLPESGVYKMAPDQWLVDMTEPVESLFDELKLRVNLIGGCCGTTPEHIRVLKKNLDKFAYFKPKSPREVVIAGREHSYEDPFHLNIGERLNVYGSLQFKKAVLSDDSKTIRQIAFNQTMRDNCDAIDINLDADIRLDSKLDVYRYLVNQSDVSRKPFVIDSTDFDLIVACLKMTGGRPIVNSISLSLGYDEFIRRFEIVKSLGAVVVIMGQDKSGIPVDCVGAEQLYNQVRGIMEDHNYQFDFFYDPCVTPICIDDKSKQRFKTFMSLRYWDKVPFFLGLSNVSFAFKGNNKFRNVLNQAVRSIYNNSTAICNVEQISQKEDTSALKALLFRYLHDEASDGDIINYALQFANQSLQRAPGIEQTTAQMLVAGDAGGVIEKTQFDVEKLTSAISEVSSWYDNGKIQVIQLLQASKTLKEVMSKNPNRSESTGISGIIATCEGDIHDIGKDIVKEVVSAQGIDVLDLGVDVSLETIKRSIVSKHSFVALSGLISPSLESMSKIINGLDKWINRPIVVMVGGAVVSQEFAESCNENCDYCFVQYGADPSETVRLIKESCGSYNE